MDKMSKTGKVIRESQIKTMHKSLVEFGYTGLTLEKVDEYVDAAIRGDKPVGGPSMFVKSWLEEARLI